MKMIRGEGPREEFARGWLAPHDRWDGIIADSPERMKWDDDVVEGDSIGGNRWGIGRNKNEREVPKKQAIPHHWRFRGGSREMTCAAENRPILPREEWGCMAEEVAWVEYKNTPRNIIRIGMVQKRLLEDAGMYG